jgi:hypothetical protein
MAVDGAEGIRRLQSLYVTGPARKREELAAVVQALSTHAAADPALRGAVAGVYAAMLDKHPEIAPTLVHDLIAWKRWDFAPGIRQAKARLNGEPLAAYALGLYLRLARVESAAAGPLPGAATEEPANAETAR